MLRKVKNDLKVCNSTYYFKFRTGELDVEDFHMLIEELFDKDWCGLIVRMWNIHHNYLWAALKFFRSKIDDIKARKPNGWSYYLDYLDEMYNKIWEVLNIEQGGLKNIKKYEGAFAHSLVHMVEPQFLYLFANYSWYQVRMSVIRRSNDINLLRSMLSNATIYEYLPVLNNLHHKIKILESKENVKNN